MVDWLGALTRGLPIVDITLHQALLTKADIGEFDAKGLLRVKAGRRLRLKRVRAPRRGLPASPR